jgi:hypothetical protein
VTVAVPISKVPLSNSWTDVPFGALVVIRTRYLNPSPQFMLTSSATVKVAPLVGAVNATV